MAQYSIGWTTNGTGDGISGGYTQAKFTDWQEALLVSVAASKGVSSFGSSLFVSASGGSASPVTIENGAAMVKGFFYRNDAAGTLNIPTPAAATRIDRIVLRADWGSQVVRFQRVAGNEGGGTPALTQTDETTWEIPIATVSITVGGVATVTDGRSFLTYNTKVSSGMIETDAVTTTKIPNRTRSFFVPPTYAENLGGTAAANVAGWWVFPNGTGYPADVTMYGHASVPVDYVSGFSSVAIFMHAALGAAGSGAITNSVYYANGASESILTNGSSVGSVLDIPANGQMRTDAVTLGGIAVGDVFQLRANRDADVGADTGTSSLHGVGWLVSYTADS